MGLLLDISEILSEKGFNIDAISAHASGNFALIGIITNDNLGAIETLSEFGFEAIENNALLAEIKHTPGILRYITNRLK